MYSAKIWRPFYRGKPFVKRSEDSFNLVTISRSIIMKLARLKLRQTVGLYSQLRLKSFKHNTQGLTISYYCEYLVWLLNLCLIHLQIYEYLTCYLISYKALCFVCILKSGNIFNLRVLISDFIVDFSYLWKLQLKNCYATPSYYEGLFCLFV